MDRLNMSLLDDKKIDGNTDEPREMELLMEWLINQSCPIAGNENFPPLKDDQIVTGNHSQAMDETDRKSASVITRSTNAACQMMYPTDSAIGTTTPEPKTEKTIATFEVDKTNSWSAACLFVCLLVCVCLPACVICLSVYLPVCLSVCLSVCSFVCLFLFILHALCLLLFASRTAI